MVRITTGQAVSSLYLFPAVTKRGMARENKKNINYVVFFTKLLQVSGLSFIFAIKHYVKIKIMAKRNEIYKSAASGSLVEVLNAGEGQLAGDLELLVENTTDAATEKHVPVVEKIEGGARLTMESTVEVEGSERPALVAETLSLIYE